jgi:hypothetical protein
MSTDGEGKSNERGSTPITLRAPWSMSMERPMIDGSAP